jgi:hypothetical protein
MALDRWTMAAIAQDEASKTLQQYKIDEKIYGEAPAYNKLVFNDNNYAHATSMLAVNAPFRQTVQLFWKIGK